MSLRTRVASRLSPVSFRSCSLACKWVLGRPALSAECLPHHGPQLSAHHSVRSVGAFGAASAFGAVSSVTANHGVRRCPPSSPSSTRSPRQSRCSAPLPPAFPIPCHRTLSGTPLPATGQARATLITLGGHRTTGVAAGARVGHLRAARRRRLNRQRRAGQNRPPMAPLHRPPDAGQPVRVRC